MLTNKITLQALERYKRHAGKVYDKLRRKKPLNHDAIVYWRNIYNECERQIYALTLEGYVRNSKPYYLAPEGKYSVKEDGEMTLVTK